MSDQANVGTHASGLHKAWLLALGSLVLLAAMVALLRWQAAPRDGVAAQEPLLLYCGAGLKAPVEAAVREYERAYGVRVQLQYGGAQTLLTGIEVARKGDLYLPGDESYLELARGKGLLDEITPLAEMRPVLAVKKGNPKNVKSLDGLLRNDVRICQANPDAAAVGKLTREALQKCGRWDAVKERTIVFKPTVNDVANDIKVGSVDAGFVWDATVKQYPELESVPLADLAGSVAHTGVGVLTCSANRAAARRLARYLGARDKGLVEFERAGFTPVAGEPWAETSVER